MSDLETQVREWVDARNAGATPVSIEEVMARADTLILITEPLPARSGFSKLGGKRVVAAAAVVLFGIAAAWVLVDRDSQDVATPPASEQLDGDLARLVALTPDDPDQVGWAVTLYDLEAARIAAEVPRPEPGAEPAEFLEYLVALGSQTHFDLPHQIRTAGGGGGPEALYEAIRRDYGLDLLGVRAWASWGDRPDETIALLGGADDASVRRAATSNDWPGEMTEHDYRGVTIYAWLDDLEAVFGQRTDTNDLGQSRRLAVIDDLLLVTATTPSMEAAIDRALDAPSAGAQARSQAAAISIADKFWSTSLLTARGLDHGAYAVGAVSGEATPTGLTIAVTPVSGSSLDQLRSELRTVLDATLEDLSLSHLTESFEVEADAGLVTLRLEGQDLDLPDQSDTAPSHPLAPDQEIDPFTQLARQLLDVVIGGTYSSGPQLAP